MASFWFHRGLFECQSKLIDMDSSGDVLKVILVTTASQLESAPGTARDVATVSAISPLAEYENVTGYNLFGETLTGKSLTEDDTNHLTKFTATNVTWTSLAQNTNDSNADCTGALIYKETTSSDFTDAVPLCFIDVTNFNGTGNNVVFQWNSNGIMTIDT